jgi:hypothetical protein
MAHVIKTLQDNLPDDPFFPSTDAPVLAKLIEKGALGQKTGAGFYKKVGKDILRLDPAKGEYVAGGGKADEIVERMLKKPGRAAEAAARVDQPASPVPVGHPARRLPLRAVHLEAIADNARDVDFAMRWGFGMKQGPFELWQEAGWQQVAEWVKADIDAGKALSAAPLPAWVFDGRTACTRRRLAGARRARPTCRAAACRCTTASTSAKPCWARAPRPPLKSRHRGLQERRSARLDAGRRGADRQHHRQAAPHQPGRDRTAWPRPSGTGRSRLPGPGDLVARRRVLGRRQPRIADAGVHEAAAARASRPRSRSCRTRCCASATRRCRWCLGDARHGAGRRLRAGRAQRQARGRDGKLHRPGRSRRGPDPRRRWPGLRGAPCGRDGQAVQGRSMPMPTC